MTNAVFTFNKRLIITLMSSCHPLWRSRFPFKDLDDWEKSHSYTKQSLVALGGIKDEQSQQKHSSS